MVLQQVIEVISILSPIVITITLGFTLVKKNFLTHDFISELNKLVFWVALPCLVVRSISTSSRIPDETLPLLSSFSLATIVVILLTALYTKLTGMKRFHHAAFIQGAFRGNLAFIAIPVILIALRNKSASFVDSTLALTFFVFAPTMLIYNVTSVVLLVIGQKKQDNQQSQLLSVIKSTASNPLIIASFIGVLLFLLPVKLPESFNNTLGYIGKLAGPASLICVGGSMAKVGLRGQLHLAGISSCIKVFILPLVAFIVSMFWGLDALSLFVLLILSASPTAVAGYIMVKAMHGDEDLASTNIVISTLLSIISLSCVLVFFPI